QILIEKIEDLVLLPLEQRHFELELAVEMVLDDRFVAAGDKNEMLDTGLAGLVNDMMDQRPIDHRQHPLGHCLGPGQEPGAKPGYRKNRFADGFHALAVAGRTGGFARWVLVSKLLSKLAVIRSIRAETGRRGCGKSSSRQQAKPAVSGSLRTAKR